MKINYVIITKALTAVWHIKCSYFLIDFLLKYSKEFLKFTFHTINFPRCLIHFSDFFF